MSNETHTDFRRAALEAAGVQAGAHDPADMAAFIPASEPMNPADAVAALKVSKPHLFKPKSAKDMSEPEYEAALRKAGGNTRGIRREQL